MRIIYTRKSPLALAVNCHTMNLLTAFKGLSSNAPPCVKNSAPLPDTHRGTGMEAAPSRSGSREPPSSAPAQWFNHQQRQ